MHLVTREDENLLLELLNTTPVTDGERVDELSDTRESANWAVAHGGTGAAGEVKALRRVRDAIQNVINGTSPAQTLATHLEKITLRPRLHDGAVSWELRVPVDATLAARALLAWTAINDRAPDRLRPCANPECCSFLIDRSNANKAQWCSMAVCGNRMKVRRHYRRTRTSGE